MLKWIVYVCAMIVLVGCGAQVTEEPIPANEVTTEEQALQGSHGGGKWHSFLKRQWRHHHGPGQRHGWKPPKPKFKDECARRGLECGTVRSCGRQIDCGECATNENCEHGMCVVDCVPDGSTTTACASDGNSVETLNSCGDVVQSVACQYGCVDGACLTSVCGDGITQAGEACDDGDTEDNNACSNACTVNACGDGEVHIGEECDDGNADDLDACSNSCTLAVCGDGIVQAGEACDDGNTVDTDLCTAACQTAVCGDGIVQPGNGEACDNGSLNGPFGACSLTCQVPFCGDGIRQPGELCDDGNTDDTDECTSACTLPACGDGITQVTDGEQCDDGNMVNDDACTNMCRLPACGDHIVQSDEECDDGNDISTDGCTNTCTLPVCGDGIVHPGEDCDDGNTDAGDGCSAVCLVEDKLVFVTSEVYTGDLGGLEGADAKCQALADAAGLPGTYKPWLSDGVDSPSTRFTQGPGRYTLVDGTVIAEDFPNLTDSSLDAAISLDEWGNSPPVSTTVECGPSFLDTLVWSGTSANGNAQIVSYCDGWTSATGNAHTGDRSSLTGRWSQWCFPGCDIEAPLYCFQQ